MECEKLSDERRIKLKLDITIKDFLNLRYITANSTAVAEAVKKEVCLKPTEKDELVRWIEELDKILEEAI